MQRAGGNSANLRPPWWSVAVGAFAAAVAAWSWIGWKALDGEPPGAAALALPMALLLVAAAAGAAGFEARARAEHRRLAEALRETRSRLHCLDDVLDVWQWRTDAAHRLVEIRPPHGASAVDWRPPVFPAELWTVFHSADEIALRARMASGAPLDDVEVGRAGADTAPGWHGVLRGRSLRDALGDFAGYQGVVRERIAAAAEPLPQPAATDAAGAEQESFTYTVSHDLRAPIRVVEGFTKIVKEDYGRLLDRVGNDHLDRVLGAAARMNNMIDALLALSRLASQPLARQTVNLSQLAGYVADDLRRQSPERNVLLTIEPGLRIQGDPTLLRVVLENLLGNAWKYTAKAPQAHVHFERNPTAPDTFTVRDNGAGFDMRFADRLFGVFQRLHSANDFAGTGVGLASVRRIVRRHGGEIWGEAEVNRGARFHFSLPQPAGASTWVLPPSPVALPPRSPDVAGPLGGVAETGAALPLRGQLAGAPASSVSSSRSA